MYVTWLKCVLPDVTLHVLAPGTSDCDFTWSLYQGEQVKIKSWRGGSDLVTGSLETDTQDRAM